MVEFALTLPILLLFIATVLDAGHGVLAWASIGGAVRDGARSGGIAYPGPSWAQEAHDRTFQNLVAVDPASVTVDVTIEPGLEGSYVVVQATYTFRPSVLLLFPQAPSIPLAASGRALAG